MEWTDSEEWIDSGDIKQLCKEAAEVFMSEPCLLELQAPIKICGHISGQYDDLLRIFDCGDFPPKSNYLFLGNYTYKRRQDFQTLRLLLAYKIKYPNNFFLLRGEYEEVERIECLCKFYSRFDKEAAVLSKVRHPNLVTLIGFCSQPFALVYEYLSKGSLEDRLVCKDGSPSLSWQVRTRIISEIRSTLIFLHSNKPHPVVHGDLKPDNTFLDANMVSKLGDFGICSFLDSSGSNSFYHLTDHPKGTLGYIDPEYLINGLLTTQSDVYSFGVIILRLVSGRPVKGIIDEARKAINRWTQNSMIDPTASDWPAAHSKELIKLGLKCCNIDRKKRPELSGKAWRAVEATNVN